MTEYSKTNNKKINELLNKLNYRAYYYLKSEDKIIKHQYQEVLNLINLTNNHLKYLNEKKLSN